MEFQSILVLEKGIYILYNNASKHYILWMSNFSYLFFVIY